MTWGNASPVELIGTVIVIIGLLVNLWALVDATRDAQALETADINGARRMIARANIEEEALRVLVQLTFVVIGLSASLSPPGHGFRLQGVSVFTAGLIIAVALNVTKAILARRHRMRVIAYLTKHGE